MKQDIIIPSWELVNKASLIKKFFLFPSIVLTGYLSVIIAYQIWYTYIYLFWLNQEFFSWLISIIQQKSGTIMIFVWIILILTYVFIIPIAEWWLITLIDSYSKKDSWKYTVWNWISWWLLNFLKIFEYNNFTAIFRPVPITTFHIFLLRFMWLNYLPTLVTTYLIYLFFAFLINSLLSYTKFIIVFEDQWLFEAMSTSTKMAISNLGMTFKLYFSVIIVHIRVLLTLLITIIFPIIISLIFTYLTAKILIWLSIIVAVILFAIILLIISQINMVTDIFIVSMWYNAYKIAKGEKSE